MDGGNGALLEKVNKLKKYVDRTEVDGSKLKKVLLKLEDLDVTKSILQSTGIGKSVNKIRKREDVGEIAKHLIEKWKNVVTQDSTKKSNEESKSKAEECINDRANKHSKRHHKISRKSEYSRESETGDILKSDDTADTDNNSMSFEQSLLSSQPTASKPHRDRSKVQSNQLSNGVANRKKSSDHGEKPADKSTKSHDRKKHTSRRKSGEKTKSRKKETTLINVPAPKETCDADIMSSLPEITPNYKPLRYPELEDSPSKKRTDTESYALIGSKSHTRTAVYSGRKNTGYSKVLSLYDLSMNVLKENIDAIDYIGGVPYAILKPVLVKCNPTQLYTLEDNNPYLIEDTDELWTVHSLRDFKGCEPDEMEAWRELYLRKHDEREHRLKKITANIALSSAKQLPVRVAKLAYVDSFVKPPRDVRRRQAKFGTAGPVEGQKPLEKLTSRGGSGVFKNAVPLGKGSPQRQMKVVKTVAPMMKKTLRFIKGIHRR